MNRAAWRSCVFLSVAIAVLLTHVASAAPGTSFPTPEAAVQHFVKRLAADDLDGALQAFNLDEVMARVDAGLKARMNDPSTPSKYRTFARVAKINVMAELASQTRRFVYGLLLDETQDQVTEATDANIARFIRAVDPARLKAVRIVRIDPPLHSITTSAAAIERAKEYAAMADAEEWTERIALFLLDGKYYRGGFTLLRYGDSWRISRLQSIYGRVESRGSPVRKTTVPEYEELTK